jgi:hypothetical protein
MEERCEEVLADYDCDRFAVAGDVGVLVGPVGALLRLDERTIEIRPISKMFATVTTAEKGAFMSSNNNDRNNTAPGEKAPGKFHFNPGNMSGNDIGEDESKQQAKTDQKQSRSDAQDHDR